MNIFTWSLPINKSIGKQQYTWSSNLEPVLGLVSEGGTLHSRQQQGRDAVMHSALYCGVEEWDLLGDSGASHPSQAQDSQGAPQWHLQPGQVEVC